MISKSKFDIPRDCYITLTNKCNMRCLHCFGNYEMSRSYKKELSGTEWHKIITNLAENNIFFVNISGGEPTIHPDFLKIMESLKKNNMLFLLTTNGIFDEKVLKILFDVRELILGIKISLDGYDNDTYSYLRRDSHGEKNDHFFRQVCDNCNTLINSKIPISIATCLHPQIIKDLDKMIDLIINIKPKAWYISTIGLSGRAKDNTSIFVSESVIPKEKWEELFDKCKMNGIQVRFNDMPSLIKSSSEKIIYFTCPAARHFCEINADGQVSPCPLARIHIRTKEALELNIVKKDIKQIWHSEYFHWFLKLQQQGCNGCIVHDKCDRCIPQSIQWFNDALMPPPYCIIEGEKLKLENINKLKSILTEYMGSTNRMNYVGNLNGTTQ